MKKIFSVHLSQAAFEHLVSQLGLETGAQLSRYCTAALKDVLECSDALLCASEIENYDLTWDVPLESPRIVVSTSKCERQAIAIAAEKLSVSPNQVCSVLINWSVMQSLTAVTEATNSVPESRSSLGGILNEAQNRTINWALENGWSKPKTPRNKVLYSELGTGSGKTLLALTLAKTAATTGQRTWIAVPSLSIQKQFLAEYTQRFGKNNRVLVALVSGRNEFVSEQRLLSILEDEKPTKENNQWLTQAQLWIDRLADKPHGADRRRWLMGSFFEHVKDFPYADSDICITTECLSDDAGVLSYEDQFNLADRSDIVILSHHYLAMETMARVRAGVIGLSKDEQAKDLVKAIFSESRIGARPGQKLTHAEVLALIDQKNQICASLFDPNEVGRLVLPNKLIVDEAHQLEENFSSANTIKISVRRLPILFAKLMKLKLIKSTESETPPTRIYEKLQSVCTRLSSTNVSSPGAKVFLNWSSPSPKDKAITEYAEDLATIMTSFAINGNIEEASNLRRSQYAFKRMLSAARYNVALFSNSPIRQYPQILFGSTNHAADFRMLFNALGVESTILLSATIFLPSIGGAWSSTRFLSNLGLRPEETTGLRIEPQAWLTQPVTVYMAPKPSDISRDFGAGHTILHPSNDQKETQTWIKQLSVLCDWSTSTAAGGTLILMTSYESASLLYKELLKQAPSLKDAVLLSGPQLGARPSDLSARFIELYQSGIRPVWIAVGSVWTGLNLSDPSRPAEQDNLLTDLIIPRTPYSLNQSISAAAKGLTAAKHIQALEEAGSTLKQGIGRLVRREGVPCNRRIFYIDSRIYEKNKKALLNMSTALLRPYGEPALLPRTLIKQLVEYSTPAKPKSPAHGRASSAYTKSRKIGFAPAVEQTPKAKSTSIASVPAPTATPTPRKSTASPKKTFGSKNRDASKI